MMTDDAKFALGFQAGFAGSLGVIRDQFCPHPIPMASPTSRFSDPARQESNIARASTSLAEIGLRGARNGMTQR